MIVSNVGLAQLRKQTLIDIWEKFCYHSDTMRARKKTDGRTLAIIRN